MIQCPSCDKQIADDSAHCGYCGHQLTSGSSKTMFGMAAVTDVDVEQVKAATQAAKEAAERGGDGAGGGDSKPKLPSPSLPNPGGFSSKPGSGTVPRPGGLSLPRPAESAQAGGADDTADDLGAGAGVPPDQAKTEAMAPIEGPPIAGVGNPDPLAASPSAAEPAAENPAGAPPAQAQDLDTAPPSPSKTPMWGEQSSNPEMGGPSGDAPVKPPSSDGPSGWGDDDAVSGDDAWADDASGSDAWGSPAKVSSDSSWGDPSTAPTTPDQPAAAPASPGGFGDSGMPQGSPNAPMATGGGGGFPGDSDSKKDNKKMLLYVGLGVGGLIMLCCVINLIFYFI